MELNIYVRKNANGYIAGQRGYTLNGVGADERFYPDLEALTTDFPRMLEEAEKQVAQAAQDVQQYAARQMAGNAAGAFIGRG
ncbi:MAG: hypothetical protein ACK4S3_06145 [Parvibaculum sp.]